MGRILALGAAWALWCILHSLLIARPVTDRLRVRLGRRFGYYRLAYNAFSLATLAPLAALHWRLRGAPVVSYPGGWLALAVLMNGIAGALFALGARAYGLADFLGWRSALAAYRGTAPAAPAFSTRGVLRWVRHPWYLAGLLVLWGHDLDAAGLTAAAVLSVYLVVGASLEERKLVAEHGDAYRAYQRSVPMLLPKRPARL
jgi:protein-S-isoprenylcysteine O-methyltransferase Ste14